MADTVFTASEISRFHSKTPALREVFPEIVRAGDRLCHRAIPTIPRTNESGALKLRAPNGCTASQHWALGRHDSPVEGRDSNPQSPGEGQQSSTSPRRLPEMLQCAEDRIGEFFNGRQGTTRRHRLITIPTRRRFTPLRRRRSILTRRRPLCIMLRCRTMDRRFMKATTEDGGAFSRRRWPGDGFH
jgi:hypothetical protein